MTRQLTLQHAGKGFWWYSWLKMALKTSQEFPILFLDVTSPAILGLFDLGPPVTWTRTSRADFHRRRGPQEASHDTDGVLYIQSH